MPSARRACCPLGRPSRMFPRLIFMRSGKWNRSRLNSPTGQSSRCPPTALGIMRNISSTSLLQLVKQKGTAAKVKEAFAALVKVRKEMSPFFNFPEDKTVAKKETRKRSSETSMSPSRPRNPSRLIRPRRLTNCSVALSSARRERNGTG